jgi:hypothetical protein
MLALIPSLASLESNDDDLLATELWFVRLREQVAVVRTIADHIDHFAEPGNADGLREQVLEEMTRLGCRLLEAAAAMTRTPTLSRATAEGPTYRRRAESHDAR